MPPALEAAWHTHGYYGSVSHNVKAIYQRYMGWYDANPANLWPHPPVEVARRYVDAMGGADAAVAVAQQAYDSGDYRWVVEVCNHVLFADDTHAGARALQADALEQIGFGAENGTWRNAFLSGAHELRHGKFGTPTTAASADLIGALTVPQVFDSIGIRIDGPRAWDEHLTIAWVVTDERHHPRRRTPQRRPQPPHRRHPTDRDHHVHAHPQRLIGLVTGTLDLQAALADGTVGVDGDPGVLATLVGFLAPVDPNFAIVTP